MRYIFVRSYVEALKIGTSPEKSFVIDKDGNLILGFTVEKRSTKEKNHGRPKNVF